MAQKLPFYSSCVTWPSEYLQVLEFLIEDGKEITRRTFLKHADADPSEIPAWDAYIDYYKKGPIYWYVHSAIEHVFAEPEWIEDLATKIQEAAVTE